MTQPFVSVAIMAYNRTEFIEAAVESVRAQTLARSEYEIVVIKNFEDPMVDARRDEPGFKILWDDSPGLGAMMAKAVDACAGSVICFLDDDDLFEPGKLARVAQLFRADPTLTFIHDGITAIDRTAHPIPGWEQFRPPPAASYSVTNDAERRARTPAFFRDGASVHMSAMSLRASLARTELDRLRRLRASPDLFAFFAALAHDGTVRVESERLTRYRLHSSASHAEVDEGGWASEARRLVGEVETASLVEEMTRGTAAETAGRGYAVEARFQYYLMVPGAASPPGREYVALLRAAWSRRQAYLVIRALWGVAKRIAPRSTTRAYHRRSRARLARATGS